MITLSLMLDTESWDIGLDDRNNLQTVGNPYACSQDVATACSTFTAAQAVESG
ncbi:hypothetical protein PCO85_18845 [Prodigiosinella aquatilis]|nr:hypothetical protein [Prodigiosinella sp. LS101]WJV53212.1 hypothetical protein PCO85_18845 [Prodigiosinella sp. LS101]WJV57572.1 hypothetical protein PCO84_18825 [Pectobacteriaceae bacterium C111]